MIFALIGAPLAAGLFAFLIRRDVFRRWMLVGAAVFHFVLVAACWVRRPTSVLDGWLGMDAAGLIVLSLASVLFLAASGYALGYLRREAKGPQPDVFEEGSIFVNEPEAVFTGCLLFFLAAMTGVTLCRHMGLFWVMMEATTLATAPLICFHRQHRSLEATWKYLLICSVGIALALAGNFCLAVSAAAGDGDSSTLVLESLLRRGPAMNVFWLKAAFLLFLVGYGTKMGLAPMHTWLPDAHSEAPSTVSALLSGGLLNCAFLGLWRAEQIIHAAGQAPFSDGLFRLFGLLSLATADVFLLGQTDFKRMLAYSSVEHMGIISLGIGLGGAGAFGSFFHAVNHSLVKAGLFLTAGNLLHAFHTKTTSEVRGALSVRTFSGVLWLAGFVAILGLPPFGPFLSEIAVLKAAFDGGRWAVSAAFLAILALIFVGMSRAFLGMAQGRPPETIEKQKEEWSSVLPPLALLLAALWMGLFPPDFLMRMIREASGTL